jgi:hypothetical protein
MRPPAAAPPVLALPPFPVSLPPALVVELELLTVELQPIATKKVKDHAEIESLLCMRPCEHASCQGCIHVVVAGSALDTAHGKLLGTTDLAHAASQSEKSHC